MDGMDGKIKFGMRVRYQTGVN